jgi:hypothetical protein
MHSLKLILVTLLIFSCNDTTQKFDQQALDVKRQNIISFINTAACVNHTGCRFIAVGSKPCGGPAEFFVYSATLDSTKLVHLVNAYSEEMHSYNIKWKISSDCSVPPQPDSTRCLNGTCYGYWSGTARRQE